MSIPELEDYLEHLKMLAKMEDKFLLNAQLESEKPIHRQLHSYNYDLQDYAYATLKKKKDE